MSIAWVGILPSNSVFLINAHHLVKMTSTEKELNVNFEEESEEEEEDPSVVDEDEEVREGFMYTRSVTTCTL